MSALVGLEGDAPLLSLAFGGEVTFFCALPDEFEVGCWWAASFGAVFSCLERKCGDGCGIVVWIWRLAVDRDFWQFVIPLFAFAEMFSVRIIGAVNVSS